MYKFIITCPKKLIAFAYSSPTPVVTALEDILGTEIYDIITVTPVIEDDETSMMHYNLLVDLLDGEMSLEVTEDV